MLINKSKCIIFLFITLCFKTETITKSWNSRNRDNGDFYIIVGSPLNDKKLDFVYCTF